MGIMDGSDALLLARAQFGLNIAFHILFPTLTIGLAWILVYFLAFAIAQTKLPHYTAPLYPALAILVARLLSGWMRREFDFPRWVLPVGLFGLAFTGLAILIGFLILGGAIPLDLPKVIKQAASLDSWQCLQPTDHRQINQQTIGHEGRGSFAQALLS